MNMDVYLHTTLAMGVIAIAYYAGQYFSRTKDIEDVVDSLLNTLEKEGFVATVFDKDGDKELVPISELIAKALKEAKKTT
jgi:hypothetical protein